MSAFAEALEGGAPRTLIIDIETAPNVVYTWGLREQNVALNQIVEPGRTICWAAKWYADPEVIFRSEHHDGRDDMIAEAWRLIDAADIVVGYNHRAFDLKHLNAEFVREGYGPPAPHLDVDLLTVARRRFRFPSNKLDWVARELGVGHKVTHSGFDLWRGCLAGDTEAWATMRRYNEHDVVLTEQVYDQLRGWVPNHPPVTLWRDGYTADECRACGAGNLEPYGYRYTATRRYPLFRCGGCGAHTTGKKADR